MSGPTDEPRSTDWSPPARPLKAIPRTGGTAWSPANLGEQLQIDPGWDQADGIHDAAETAHERPAAE